MSAPGREVIEFLKELLFFKGLPQADMAEMISHSSVEDILRHQDIFHQGDAAENLFVILHGWVKIFNRTAEGDEAVIAVLTRGDIFGERSILENTDYSFTAEAAENLELLVIEASVLRERAALNPDIMKRVISSMSRDMKSLQMENEHLSVMTAPQRVGCLLLQLSSHIIGKGGTFVFPYDKSLAAARLGMKPETFSRALAQLAAQGVTSQGPEITIESFDRLTGFCCGHCSFQPGECRGTCRGSCAGKS